MLQNTSKARKPGFTRRRRVPGTRTHRACVNCKERKLKCDDRVPSCANCARFDLTCLVQDPESGKQRPRNYLELLEERVAVLESSEQVLDPGRTMPVSSTDHSTLSTPPMPPEAAEVASDLSSRVGMLDFRATQMEPQYLGSSSGFAFSHILNSSLRTAVPSRPTLNATAPKAATSTPSPCVLPDLDIALVLGRAYFENIHPQYPFLHEPTFRQWESQLYAEPGAPVRLDNIQNTNRNFFFVNMVYAVGALLLPNYQTLGEQLYISAQSYPEVLSYDNVEAIQALLCYAMYSLRSQTGLSLWKLTGLALRQCIELGYHRTIKRLGSGTNPLQLEMQRRVFWCAQGIDCTIASRLGRPLGIRLEEVDAEFPSDVDDSAITNGGIAGSPRSSFNDPPRTMTTALHVFRLRRIWAQIHTCIYSDAKAQNFNDRTYRDRIEGLRADLESWLASAPPPMPRNGEDLSIFAKKEWYETNYSYTILLLYRGQLAEAKGASESIFMDCMKAAKTICQRYRRLYIGTALKYTWGTLHALFLAGLTYLHCIWTSPAVHQSVSISELNSTCIDCTMVLVVIAEGWDYAAPYRDIFEALASRTMTMMLSKTNSWEELPALSAFEESADRENMNRWLADIAGMGMLDVVDDLLPGFVEDFM